LKDLTGGAEVASDPLACKHFGCGNRDGKLELARKAGRDGIADQQQRAALHRRAGRPVAPVDAGQYDVASLRRAECRRARDRAARVDRP
jgi:hypothetical protein